MPRPAWKRTVKRALKAVVAILVLAAVGRHVVKTFQDLSTHEEWVHLDPVWGVVSLLVYVTGLFTLGVVFGKVVNSGAGDRAVGMWSAIRAYVISHLGKYVPGKAMVVVLRVGLVVPYGARPATAAIATFYETLTMMAMGAILAAAGFAIGEGPLQWLPLLMGLGLAVAFLTVVEPRVFPRLTKLVSSPFPSAGPVALPIFSHRLLFTALLWSAVGWLLLGFSQIALIQAISTETDKLPIGAWPLVIGGVALATVAGFVVAVLPAGLGVREGILMATLQPSLGPDRAVIAALGLRLVWVVGEIVAAGAAAVFRPAIVTPSPTFEPADAPPLATVTISTATTITTTTTFPADPKVS